MRNAIFYSCAVAIYVVIVVAAFWPSLYWVCAAWILGVGTGLSGGIRDRAPDRTSEGT